MLIGAVYRFEGALYKSSKGKAMSWGDECGRAVLSKFQKMVDNSDYTEQFEVTFKACADPIAQKIQQKFDVKE